MSELTHLQIQELLGAYALDAVDGDEAEQVELHLRTCPKCRAEVLDHREVAALIAHGGGPAPEGVWDRIVTAIEPAPPPMRLELRHAEPPGADEPATVVPIASRRTGFAAADRRVLGVAAAVLVLIALMGGLIVHLNNRVDSVRTTAAASDLDNVASAAMSDHSSRTAQLTGAGGVKLPAAVTKDGEGYLLASSAPALDAKHTYQLWGIVNGTAISLGTFPGGAKVVPFRVDTRVKTLAVTEEHSGGVIASHNSPVFAADI